MNIAILGTGNVGTGLAHVFAKTPNQVVLGARTVDKGVSAARQFNESTGMHVQGTGIAEAVRLAEVVILAVPFKAVSDLLDASGDLSGKVIIDVTNPLTDDYTGLTLGFTTSAAEEIQKQVGGTPVVKAFNTVFAQVYGQGPQFGSTQVQVFVAGDNANAKQVVACLVEEAGFAPVDAGPLKNARYLEPLGALNIQLGYGLGRGTQIAPVWIERDAA